jgi:hypothetical protein
MSEGVHQELSRRNAMSVMETVNRQDIKIQEQQQRIDALGNALAAALARLTVLEQAHALQRVKMMGSGPTA